MLSTPEMVAAYMSHLLIERQADYARRGRPFRARSTPYLKARYLAAVRLYEYASDPEAAVDEMHDLEAEVGLRGESMPSLEVQRCALSRRRQEHLARLRAGPDAWGDVERKVVATATAFFDDHKRMSKH